VGAGIRPICSSVAVEKHRLLTAMKRCKPTTIAMFSGVAAAVIGLVTFTLTVGFLGWADAELPAIAVSRSFDPCLHLASAVD